MRTVRAKFFCSAITEFAAGAKRVELETSYSDNPEDNQFSKFTPSGHVSMSVDNPDIDGFFVPGKSYFLDFSIAEKS